MSVISDTIEQKRKDLMHMPEQPNYLSLARVMLQAIEKQDTDITSLQRVSEAQKGINGNFEKRISRLEGSIEKMLQDLNGKLQLLESLVKEKSSKEEVKSQEQSSDRDSRLEDELRRVFNRSYVPPERLLWILGR